MAAGKRAQGWLRRGIGLMLTLVLLASVSPKADAFEYYPAGPRGTLAVARPTIAKQIVLGPDEEIRTAFMWLDGARVEPVWDETGLVRYTPPAPLAPGEHRVKLSVEVRARSGRWDYDPLVEEFAVTVAQDSAETLPQPGPEELRALQRVNFYRTAAGVDPVVYEPALAAAALGHARYLVANPDGIASDPHGETDAAAQFTGATHQDRAYYFGYGGPVSEVINFTDRAEDAVDSWMHTLYHRIPLLRPGMRSLGYGLASGHENLVNVLELGRTDAVRDTVIYPYAGQTDVPVGWDGAESPDPMALYPGASKPVGETITLTFGGTVRRLNLTGGKLTGPDGAVPVMTFEPENDTHLKDTVALIPRAPLVPGTTYSVELAGEVDRGAGMQPFVRRWRFTTATEQVPVPQRRVNTVQDGVVQRVQVEGTGFAPGLRAFLGGLPVGGLRVESAERISFDPPAGFRGGPADLVLVTPGGKEARWAGFYDGEESYGFPGDDGETFHAMPVTLHGEPTDLTALVHTSGAVVLPEAVLDGLGARADRVKAIGRTYWSMGGRTLDYTLGQVSGSVGGQALATALPAQERGGVTYFEASLLQGWTGVRSADGQIAVGLRDLGGHWARAQVVRLWQAGIVSGGADGLYHPDDPLTRAAFVKMLAAARGLGLRPRVTGGLADVREHWVSRQGYIGAAVQAGIVLPDEYAGGQFEPDRAITRDEMAAMVTRAFGRAALLSLTGGDGPATRAEAAVMVSQALDTR